MSLRTTAGVLALASFMMLGCDSEERVESPDPDITPTRPETQPPVTDREYISPDAALPRPESPEQREYQPAPPADSPQTTPPQPEQQPAATTTDTPPAEETPVVEEVPVDSPPKQN